MSYASQQLSDYLEALVPPRDAQLQEMEAFATRENFPIIGPAAGHFCYLIARLAGARRVFELGSGYGYSTAWFARAVKENGGGEVFHTVWDEGLSARARNHLDALGYGGLVRFHVGEAVEALSATEGHFDLIFNDIDKSGYPASIGVIAKKLRPGGVLLIDNMLWGGRVLDEADTGEATEAIRETANLLATSDEWITSLVPIRDGLSVAIRR
ncbi:MAG: O-methyltransferase [Anaerolineae bacterium]|nr:O-methyltransferase [Anaerolineae bacterium]